MHALRRYIQQELDARGWRAQDLANKSGLHKQTISKLLLDDRETLAQLPRTTTLEAIAQAFDVPVAHVTTVAVQALGVPGVIAPQVVHEIREATDEVLLRELLRRAVERTANVIPMPARLPTWIRPPSEVEAELQVAATDLARFRELGVTGKSAESKRRALQLRVDALQAELVASRSATTEATSVADS